LSLYHPEPDGSETRVSGAHIIAICMAALFTISGPHQEARAQVLQNPVRIGVVGLVHDHVHWILGREERGDIEIVGIAEPNRALAQRYADQYGFGMEIVYDSVEELIEAAQPEAVTVFTSIYDHLRVTEIAARHGIHVMVEKPLAVSLEHARRMKHVADSAGIQLITNYETSWYPSVFRTRAIVEAGEIGPIRKIVVRDGHRGPKEIGVSDEFLAWLTDPELNGGGAIVDFGCYGANLITWLLDGQRPIAVTAVTQTIKPDIYPDVDDEATIIVTYPDAQGIIQASWNWPISRKDMSVYGMSGYVHADNTRMMRIRPSEDEPESRIEAETFPDHHDDPFSYFAAVVRGTIQPESDLSSLETNMIVMQILDAARESAATGRTVSIER